MPKPAGPNDRVNLGFIGFGIRGNILLEAAKETQQANLVEVCDCYQGHLERAKERTEGKVATNFAQYKKLLERKDIDAVVVATPDHWHRTHRARRIERGQGCLYRKADDATELKMAQP